MLLNFYPVNNQVLTTHTKSKASWDSLSTHITTRSANSNYSVIPFSPFQSCPGRACYKHPLRRFRTAFLCCMYCLYCNEKGGSREVNKTWNRFCIQRTPWCCALRFSAHSKTQNNGRLAHQCKVGLAVERNCLNILLIMCSRSQCEIYPLNETGRCDNPISVDFTSDIWSNNNEKSSSFLFRSILQSLLQYHTLLIWACQILFCGCRQ